jgi:ribonuclease P/MRP protein subunit RPP40
MRNKLVDYLTVNKLLNENQHGFRKGRSCLSQLLLYYDYILQKLEAGENVDIIYLDFAKAFDKVDHGILLHKLKLLGIHGQIGSWISSFLMDRSQYVAVNGNLSTASKVVSGVPQGTVLGPLLFIILMGDIDKLVTSSFVSSFADDTRAGKGVKNVSDCEILQADLNSIYDWAQTNNMEFNDSKFELIR